MRCCLVVLSFFFSALVYSQSDTSKIIFAEDVWLGQDLPTSEAHLMEEFDRFEPNNFFLPEGRYDIVFNKKTKKIKINKASGKSKNGSSNFTLKSREQANFSSNDQYLHNAEMIDLGGGEYIAYNVFLHPFYDFKIVENSDGETIEYTPSNFSQTINYYPSHQTFLDLKKGELDVLKRHHLRNLILLLDGLDDVVILQNLKGKQPTFNTSHKKGLGSLLQGKSKGVYSDKYNIVISGLNLMYSTYLDSYFKNTEVHKNVFIISPSSSISFSKYELKGSLKILHNSTQIEQVIISNCEIKGGLGVFSSKWTQINKSNLSYTYVYQPSKGNVQVSNTKFEGNSKYAKSELKEYAVAKVSENATLFMGAGQGENSIKLYGNSFHYNGRNDFVFINAKKIEINENTFETPIVFSGDCDELFNLKKNTIGEKSALVFEDFDFPEFTRRVKMNWNQVPANSVGVPLYSAKKDLTIYNAKGDSQLSLEDKYAEFIETYNYLYNIYKAKGASDAANIILVELKDAEMRRLKYVYESEGGLKNWFRWWLSWLLKTYTEHGTDPAKALVISFWIIIGFSVFYFFFPSDWDLYSKSAIIKNFRQALDKNDKKIFTPFFKAVLYFLVSFANAFTLSINSFVTLGFGQIPARGVAKYVTILQGFMGWFLLSIFSVALINQVLG